MKYCSKVIRCILVHFVVMANTMFKMNLNVTQGEPGEAVKGEKGDAGEKGPSGQRVS